MALVIGVPIKLGRVAYKAYKKHQAEKISREHGMPQTLVDPSHELDHGFDRNRSSSHQHVPAVHRTEYDDNTSHADVMSYHSAAEQAEIDRALEHDEEFRRFMQYQKHLYLDEHHGQRHSPRNLSPGPERSVRVNQLPGQPPTYDSAVSRVLPGTGNSSHDLETQGRRRRRTPVESEGQEEDSTPPASPSSVYSERESRELNETLISPVIPSRSPFRVASELPASSRLAVEMPVTKTAGVDHQNLRMATYR